MALSSIALCSRALLKTGYGPNISGYGLPTGRNLLRK